MSDLTPAASAGATREWRSIDSAPRDGTLFLGCNLDHPSFGSWPMYRRVRHSVDAAGEMVTADLGGWAMVRDLQPDWGELEPVGPEPQVSIAPDDLNRSVRYGWMPRPAPGSPAEKGEGGDIEAAAWAWVQNRYPNDAASDLAFDANEMVDAYLAGSGAKSTHPASDQSDTERMRADLEWLTGQTNLELSYCRGEEGEDGKWQVHRVSGSVNDRRWERIAQADTAGEALTKARAALAEKEAGQCVVVPPKTRYFPADFAPAYQTVAAGGLALPADPLPRIISLPGRHADPDAFAVNLSATIGDDAGACGICDVVFKTGDRCLTDISLGPVHAACCGPERESYVDLETGDALAADAPIPTPWIWNADGTISPAEVSA